MVNIDEFEALIAKAGLGSLTHASQRLHRPQVAISRRLGILEHEPGAPMFERVRHDATIIWIALGRLI